MGGGVPAWVERDFRAYLRCGILAHGFGRARCAGCGYDFLVAFSCRSRGICPSCNARRMVETAAHLVDHVLPPLPVRQWVLAVPRRLRNGALVRAHTRPLGVSRPVKLLRRRWFRLVLLPALGVLAALMLVWLALPRPGGLATENPPTTSFMRYRVEKAGDTGQTLTIHQEWTPLESMPRDLVRAVLVSEDDRFREHHGIDWKALATEVEWTGGDTFSWARPRDWVALLRAGGYARTHRGTIKGRSTITQQLAKNLYFTPERSLVRKAKEFVVTRRLERDLSKDRILEIYLNTVEMGPGLFGMGAAARSGHSQRATSDADHASARRLRDRRRHDRMDDRRRYGCPGHRRRPVRLGRFDGPRSPGGYGWGAGPWGLTSRPVDGPQGASASGGLNPGPPRTFST